MSDAECLRKKVEILKELGDDWKNSAIVLSDALRGNEDLRDSIQALCKERSQGNMIKIGLTLLAFPLPIVVDDVLGWSLLAAGLLQRKIKNSALYLEDIDEAFPSLLKEIEKIRQETI
ncbi:MAG: hypothetical protein JSV64_06685 [Candidatus Bathyarchaeota archaeon]|nr:MAG: hypothetical protein JSV64_06685 [Candidatus Bathyarchaeota archaeon]